MPPGVSQRRPRPEKRQRAHHLFAHRADPGGPAPCGWSPGSSPQRRQGRLGALQVKRFLLPHCLTHIAESNFSLFPLGAWRGCGSARLPVLTAFTPAGNAAAVPRDPGDLEIEPGVRHLASQGLSQRDPPETARLSELRAELVLIRASVTAGGTAPQRRPLPCPAAPPPPAPRPAVLPPCTTPQCCPPPRSAAPLPPAATPQPRPHPAPQTHPPSPEQPPCPTPQRCPPPCCHPPPSVGAVVLGQGSPEPYLNSPEPRGRPVKYSLIYL